MREAFASEELPQTEKFDYYEPEPSETTMEFRLIYQGPLPSAGSSGSSRRSREKQMLRKCFHKQLRELWTQHPDLREQSQTLFVKRGTQIRRVERNPAAIPEDAKTWLEHIASDYPRLGTHFVPLISEKGGFTCSLQILFLRRGNPGDLIASGGDIDNRVKVLLDGLVMPQSESDLGGIPIDPDEDPFYCLLTDDKLITNFSVTTDRLLIPLGQGERINDVCLIIYVTVHNPGAIFAGNRLV